MCSSKGRKYPHIAQTKINKNILNERQILLKFLQHYLPKGKHENIMKASKQKLSIN